MATAHFEELEQQYNANVKPITEQQLGMPILTESELAGKTPDDTWPGVEKEMPKGKEWNQSGPEAAEGWEAPQNDPKVEGNNKDDDDEQQNATSNPIERESTKKVVKKESNKINNSTMKENNKHKSSFDKLYEDVFNDEMDIDTEDEFGGEGEDFGGEEGEDTITLELDRSVAEELHSKLGDLLGGEGDIDDIEDTVGGDEFGEEDEDNPFPESHVELQAAPDSITKLATQNGGNNKVGGDANPAGGGASHDAAGQEDGGKPKVAPKGFDYASTKNNKVKGKVSGGGKHMFKH